MNIKNKLAPLTDEQRIEYLVRNYTTIDIAKELIKQLYGSAKPIVKTAKIRITEEQFNEKFTIIQPRKKKEKAVSKTDK